MNEDQPLFVATFGPNKLGCMQDFSAFTGVPEKVRFAVYQVTKDERYKLIGPGYGQKGAYGNGAIYVYATRPELIDVAFQWCNVPVIMEKMTAPAPPAAVSPGVRLCVDCGLPAELDWDESPRGPIHAHQFGCVAALKAEVARLRDKVAFDDVLLQADARAIEHLRAVEDKALEQSEFIQLHGLTVYEQARLRAEILQLRAALQAVEWAEMERRCPWCAALETTHKHRLGCPRQLALGLTP